MNDKDKKTIVDAIRLLHEHGRTAKDAIVHAYHAGDLDSNQIEEAQMQLEEAAEDCGR